MSKKLRNQVMRCTMALMAAAPAATPVINQVVQPVAAHASSRHYHKRAHVPSYLKDNLVDMYGKRATKRMSPRRAMRDGKELEALYKSFNKRNPSDRMSKTDYFTRLGNERDISRGLMSGSHNTGLRLPRHVMDNMTVHQMRELRDNRPLTGNLNHAQRHTLNRYGITNQMFARRNIGRLEQNHPGSVYIPKKLHLTQHQRLEVYSNQPVRGLSHHQLRVAREYGLPMANHESLEKSFRRYNRRMAKQNAEASALVRRLNRRSRASSAQTPKTRLGRALKVYQLLNGQYTFQKPHYTTSDQIEEGGNPVINGLPAQYYPASVQKEYGINPYSLPNNQQATNNYGTGYFSNSLPLDYNPQNPNGSSSDDDSNNEINPADNNGFYLNGNPAYTDYDHLLDGHQNLVNALEKNGYNPNKLSKHDKGLLNSLLRNGTSGSVNNSSSEPSDDDVQSFNQALDSLADENKDGNIDTGNSLDHAKAIKIAITSPDGHVRHTEVNPRDVKAFEDQEPALKDWGYKLSIDSQVPTNSQAPTKSVNPQHEVDNNDSLADLDILPSGSRAHNHKQYDYFDSIDPQTGNLYSYRVVKGDWNRHLICHRFIAPNKTFKHEARQASRYFKPTDSSRSKGVLRNAKPRNKRQRALDNYVESIRRRFPKQAGQLERNYRAYRAKRAKRARSRKPVRRRARKPARRRARRHVTRRHGRKAPRRRKAKVHLARRRKTQRRMSRGQAKAIEARRKARGSRHKSLRLPRNIVRKMRRDNMTLSPRQFREVRRLMRRQGVKLPKVSERNALRQMARHVHVSDANIYDSNHFNHHLSKHYRRLLNYEIRHSKVGGHASRISRKRSARIVRDYVSHHPRLIRKGFNIKPRSNESHYVTGQKFSFGFVR